MTDLDDTLRQIAHGLVAEAPAIPDLAALAGRADLADHRADRVRRRAVVAAVAAAAAILAVAATVAIAARSGRDDAERPPTVVADDVEAPSLPVPQHLVVASGTREVLADGEVVELEQGDLGSVETPRFRPGGGHVVVGTDFVPDAAADDGQLDREDFPGIISSRLVVVGPDGEVELEREMAHSTLVAVTDTEAILARRLVDGEYDPIADETLLVHDLATGEERPIAEGITFDIQRWLPTMTAVVGDQLYTIEAPIERGADGPCSLRIVDLGTGEDTSHTLDLDCAAPVVDLQVSPDGTRAAFGYWDTFDLASFTNDELHFAVIGLSDGTVDHHELVTGKGSVDGMAWKDDVTLRVATSPVATDERDEVTVHELPIP